MTENALTTRPSTAVTQWGDRAAVRELDNRLATMLPGADRLNTGQRMALAQASVAHGLDPFNGEVWMIPGRGLMIGVKGLRKKAREQVKGNFWIDFVELTNPEQRHRLRIPDGALAYEARLFDSENILTFSKACETLLKAGIPWEAVEKMVGTKPYTVGLGVLKAGESTKMEAAQCAMKRAEADALKRRFDVPFGFNLNPDVDTPIEGEWVIEETKKPERDRQEEAKVIKAVFAGGDEEPGQEVLATKVPTTNAPAPAEKFKPAALKVRTDMKEWRAGCAEIAKRFPKYAQENGEPNQYHILGAAKHCGFDEVTDANYEVVIERIVARATQGEPVAA